MSGHTSTAVTNMEKKTHNCTLSNPAKHTQHITLVAVVDLYAGRM